MAGEKIKITTEKESWILAELKELRESLEGGKKKCVITYPDKKYVNYIEHIISTIKDEMENYNIEVQTLPDTVKSQYSNFQEILRLLKNCILGIVILDGLRSNVVLEYGILLGLGKPIIVLKDKNAEINIKSLDDKLKSEHEKHHISNPTLDIDKHLSDVKDLHWTCYDWENPKELREKLQDDISKIKEKMLSEITKPMITQEIKSLRPENYADFQKEFSELAQYIIKFLEPDYEKISKIDKKLSELAKKYEVKLPSSYYFELGHLYYNSSDYNKAIESLDKAIEIKPDYAGAWYNKGIVLGKLKHPDEALKAFDKAIEITPNYTDAWYNKGVALGELGRYKEALKAYDKAIKIKPNYANAWHNKGVVLIYLKKYNEAVKCFDKAIELKPDFAEAWYNKGVALGNLVKHDEAVKCYDKAIEIKPDDANSWFVKGFTLGELGEYDEAIKCFDEGIEIKPDDAYAWYIKACVYSLKGDKENALKNLSRAIELNTEYKEKAKKDEDFKNLWDDEDFKKIVG